MKTGFREPMEEERSSDRDFPSLFKGPTYEKRDGCYVNAGCNYGVGHRQPVGKTGTPSNKCDALPYGRVKTMRVCDER